MALESFYGGRPGVSPVIRKSFKYVDENDINYTDSSDPKDCMAICLSDANYTDVWYNEYCIIDAGIEGIHNGEIYKRVFSSESNSPKYYEYIGRFVGPQGRTPTIIIDNIDNIEGKVLGTVRTFENDEFDSETNKLKGIANWDYGYPKWNSATNQFEVITGNPETDSDFISTGTLSMIPGAEPNDENSFDYNDTIKYTWCNVQRNDGKTQALVYLGFQIPYPVFNPDIQLVSWKENANLINGYDSEHPFYHPWTFEIPRGTPGAWITNVRKVEKKDYNEDSAEKLYQMNLDVDTAQENYRIINNNGTDASKFLSPYPAFSETKEGHKIWVCDLNIPYSRIEGKENSSEFHTATVYLGEAFGVTDADLDLESGIITFTLENGSRIQTDTAMKWVTGLDLSTDGILTAKYNIADSTPTPINNDNPIQWIKNIVLKDDGVLSVLYNTASNGTYTPIKNSNNEINKIQWISNISFNPNDGHLIIKYNTGSTDSEFPINFIKRLQIDPISDHLFVLYGPEEYRHITPTSTEDFTYEKNNITYTNSTYTQYIENKDKDNERKWVTLKGSNEGIWWEDLGEVRTRINSALHVSSLYDITKHPAYHDVFFSESFSIQETQDGTPIIYLTIEDVLRALNGGKKSIESLWELELQTTTQETITVTMTPKDENNEDISNYPADSRYANGVIPIDKMNRSGEFIIAVTYTYDVTNEEYIGVTSTFYYDYATNLWKYAGSWGKITAIENDNSSNNWYLIDNAQDNKIPTTDDPIPSWNLLYNNWTEEDNTGINKIIFSSEKTLWEVGS